MYIEFVIADNFVLTFLAAVTATGLCHKRVDVFRTVIAAALGTVVAVFYPMMRMGAVAQLAVKLALGAVLCMILFFKTSRPIASSLLFVGSTFTYGGACYALGLVIFSDASRAAAFSRRCPLFIVLCTGAAVYFCARYVIRRLHAARTRAPYEFGTSVEVFGKTLKFAAYLDTGNCVFDDVTGLPVVITDAKRFTSKLDSASSLEFLKNLDRFRRHGISTPAGKVDAYMIGPVDLTVYSADEPHKISAMVGLVGNGGFSGSHEMLLNPAVVAEGI